MAVHQNKNEIKRFATRLLIFLVTVVTVDFIAGKLLGKKYWSMKSGDDYFTTRAVTKADSQVLVFGSSRAVNIFDPAVLKNELGASCFNAGRVGQSIFYHQAVLKAVLKRYTPQLVILSLDAGDFAKDQKDYDRLSQLLPYYKSHPEIRDIVDLKGPYERIKMISFIYPYNSLLLPVLKGNLKGSSDDGKHADGYSPINKKVTGAFHKVDYSKYDVLDSNKINCFKNFVTDCKKAGAILFLVCPPYRVDAAGKDKTLELTASVAKENKITFFDYSRDTYYSTQSDYFADFRHLNKEGSGIFSRQVAQRIKEEVKESMQAQE
jgi:hypothetical protein